MPLEAATSDIHDIRHHWEDYPTVSLWRSYLRQTLYTERGGRSDVSKRDLKWGYDLHEGCIPRNKVSKASWQNLIFSGVNCFLLSRLEHEHPPSRTECYWISVARYGMNVVDQWLNSLPQKSGKDTPWVGTYGKEVLFRMAERYDALDFWEPYWKIYNHHIDMEA